MRRIFPLLLSLLLLTACAPTSSVQDSEHSVSIYYLAPSGTFRGSDAVQCRQEVLNLPKIRSPKTIATAVTQRLLEGSSDKTLLSPFPADVELISLYLLDTHAFVDLSGSFALLDGISLTLADYCLTLSLTAIDSIESVSVTANGRSLAQQPRQIFRERDAILSTKESDLRLVTVSLFFLNEDGKLTAEERILELYEGDTQSEVLATTLLKGPEDDSLTPVIPGGFQITSIKTENGICRINIPSSSLNLLPEDENEQRLILHSIARSLYSLEYIREIRLQTDGTELEKFGQVSVSEIAERATLRTHTYSYIPKTETAD